MKVSQGYALHYYGLQVANFFFNSKYLLTFVTLKWLCSILDLSTVEFGLIHYHLGGGGGGGVYRSDMENPTR